MKRTFFLLFLALVATTARAADKPNIVFFFADDQTTNTLACYGHPFVQTPNIDRLASEGTRFANAFVSHSICWVSRTTILTGLTGRTYGTPGQRDLARPEAVETLYSDLLRDAGYRTGYFGKWHAKMPPGYRREDHFDEFQAIGRNPFLKKQPDGSLRHETDLIVDRGIEFIKNQPKDKPFALNMWFNACHAEDGDRRPGIGHFTWPQSANGLYEDRVMPLPRLNDPSTFDDLPEFLKTTINRDRYFWRWNTEQKYQTNMRAYLRMVTGIDNAIGRFVEALEEAGLADNTIIVYTADNGYYMANRGLAGKWAHHDESLRVPMIIMDPRVPPSERGKVTDAFALNLDLPSTFLDWANVEIPERYQGHSLRPIIDGEKPSDWRKETFHEHFAVRNRIPVFEGVRNSKWKYARYVDDANYEFLHDLTNDPDELINLAYNPDHADTLAELRKLTDDYVASYGGSLLPPGQKFTKSTQPHPIASANGVTTPGKDGFVNLIGRNLNNWAGSRELWSIKDGVLTGVTDGKMDANQFLTWKGSTIRNFDLRVQVRISADGNSGIQYRSFSRPEIGLDVVSGYQCDIAPRTPHYDGMLYEERQRRIISGNGDKVVIDESGQPWIVGEFPAKEFPADEWHEYRVLAQGNHLRHWIDGHPTVEVIDFDPVGRSQEGVLALQIHRGPPMKIEFKDLRIRHLPDELPLLEAMYHPIPKGSLGVKPQGRLPRDWKPPVYGETE